MKKITWTQKSPLMEPGLLSAGLVSPSITLDLDPEKSGSGSRKERIRIQERADPDPKHLTSIAYYLDAEVSPDGAGLAVCRVRLAQHHTGSRSGKERIRIQERADPDPKPLRNVHTWTQKSPLMVPGLHHTGSGSRKERIRIQERAYPDPKHLMNSA